MTSEPTHRAPLERCGLAWSEEESAILYRLLETGRDVREAFHQIGRGEDAIKRKWRKILADKRDKRRHFAVSRGTVDEQVHRLHQSFSSTNQHELDSSNTTRDDEASSSSEPITDVSSYSPSSNSLAGESIAIGAACDDCRQKHKRCGHRFKTKRQAHSTTRRKLETHSTRASETRYQDYIGRTSGSTSKKVDKPVSLTSNGKRRGRPPKSPATCRVPPEPTNKNTTSKSIAERAVKLCRRSTDDREERTIILGDPRACHMHPAPSRSGLSHHGDNRRDSTTVYKSSRLSSESYKSDSDTTVTTAGTDWQAIPRNEQTAKKMAPGRRKQGKHDALPGSAQQYGRNHRTNADESAEKAGRLGRDPGDDRKERTILLGDPQYWYRNSNSESRLSESYRTDSDPSAERLGTNRPATSRNESDNDATEPSRPARVDDLPRLSTQANFNEDARGPDHEMMGSANEAREITEQVALHLEDTTINPPAEQTRYMYSWERLLTTDGSAPGQHFEAPYSCVRDEPLRTPEWEQ